jgi:hypothetical protein
MRRQDIVSIIVTFVVGLLTGGYLYLFGFSQQFSLDELSESVATPDRDFTMTIEAYGGCDRSGRCPRYVVGSDGAVTGTVPATPEAGKVTGQLDQQLWLELQDYFYPEQLDVLSEPMVSADDCASADDGVDYQVTVIRGSVTYRLDTCRSALAEDDVAYALLLDVVDSVPL